MSWTRSSEVSSDDGPAGDDSLPAKDDVLRSGDRCATGDFVPCVLRDFLSESDITQSITLTVSMNSAFE